jgi:AGCS family alanine or glycine:cation symporter
LLARSLNATEAGIGTAGILYGGTGTKNQVRSGIMAMATSFISNHLVCFNIMLLIIASGAWKSGVNGTGLTILAYETVYGALGGWVVTILSALFGLGVLIAYAYIGRECWSFLTGGRYFAWYTGLYCIMALVGSLAEISLVWNSIDIAIAGLVIINLYALLMLLPQIRKAVIQYEAVENKK